MTTTTSPHGISSATAPTWRPPPPVSRSKTRLTTVSLRGRREVGPPDRESPCTGSARRRVAGAPASWRRSTTRSPTESTFCRSPSAPLRFRCRISRTTRSPSERSTP
ncbi:unnamed protein product [Linum tenue]|uniref:Uncharacterized protein n=1 Tax=Linum tenue TaxID=586396 RepID=A0AAV0HB19_9ROSI|nr:unnamed protein product [Linum tenue]